jgi:hypothetical protein
MTIYGGQGDTVLHHKKREKNMATNLPSSSLANGLTSTIPTDIPLASVDPNFFHRLDLSFVIARLKELMRSHDTSSTLS